MQRSRKAVVLIPSPVLHAFDTAVLDGLQAAMRLVGASAGWVGIKDKYHDVIDAPRPSLPGGVDIALLRDTYPAGDEFILVYDVLGLIIPPGGNPPPECRGGRAVPCRRLVDHFQ